MTLTSEGGGVLLQAINAKFGTQLGPNDVTSLGLRVLQAKREFNQKAGFTNKDDRLPEFFYKEPLPPHIIKSFPSRMRRSIRLSAFDEGCGRIIKQ
ncbi:aldehyde ferredoxin oxidoreductase C-terminal domain-containing protein [Thermodesulfobacteriota bacterium]